MISLPFLSDAFNAGLARRLPFTATIGTGSYPILARRNLDKRFTVYTLIRSPRVVENKAVTNLQVTKAEPETLCRRLHVLRIPNVADILKVILILFKRLDFQGFRTSRSIQLFPLKTFR